MPTQRQWPAWLSSSNMTTVKADLASTTLEKKKKARKTNKGLPVGTLKMILPLYQLKSWVSMTCEKLQAERQADREGLSSLTDCVQWVNYPGEECYPCWWQKCTHANITGLSACATQTQWSFLYCLDFSSLTRGSTGLTGIEQTHILK